VAIVRQPDRESTIRSGLDEAFRVTGDTPIEPAGVGNRAGHDEDVTDVARLDAPGGGVPPAHTFDVVDAFEADDFRVRSEYDLRIVLDSPDQIA